MRRTDHVRMVYAKRRGRRGATAANFSFSAFQIFSFSHMPPDRSIVRQLKTLVAILVASNIALGLFGFCFLRHIDRKYSELIERTVPTLNDLQTLTAMTTAAMRSTRVVVEAKTPEQISAAAQAARVAIDRDRDLRNSILTRETMRSDLADCNTLAAEGDKFSAAARQVVDTAAAGNVPDALRQREDVLRPSSERYINATTKMADALEAEGLRSSNALSSITGSFSTFILGVGSWPVVAIALLLAFSAVFVVVVLVNTRVREREAL